MENLRDKVVLIGMPGCGKSTISEALSKKLNYDFYDMDAYIEEISGEKIPTLFSKGEELFRNWESKACQELCRKQRVVIACGGGVVERDENIHSLQKDSIIIFINRPIEEIAKDIDITKRPLLKAGIHKLSELYNKRIHLYQKAAHISIQNDGSIEQMLSQIEEKLKGVANETNDYQRP